MQRLSFSTCCLCVAACAANVQPSSCPQYVSWLTASAAAKRTDEEILHMQVIPSSLGEEIYASTLMSVRRRRRRQKQNPRRNKIHSGWTTATRPATQHASQQRGGQAQRQSVSFITRFIFQFYECVCNGGIKAHLQSTGLFIVFIVKLQRLKRKLIDNCFDDR